MSLGVEDLQGVMKRVAKKASLMVKGITVCQALIDHNFGVIKQYLTEGRRPNFEFKRQIKGIANEFVKVADIRFGRVDAEQVYDKAQEDWKRQMNIISENKKLKQETEKLIEQALDKKKGTTKPEGK